MSHLSHHIGLYMMLNGSKLILHSPACVQEWHRFHLNTSFWWQGRQVARSSPGSQVGLRGSYVRGVWRWPGTTSFTLHLQCLPFSYSRDRVQVPCSHFTGFLLTVLCFLGPLQKHSGGISLNSKYEHMTLETTLAGFTPGAPSSSKF